MPVAVATAHQGARIVAQYGARHAAELCEGRGNALAPVVAPLIEKCFDEEVTLTARLVAALREHRHLRGARVLYQDDGTPLTEGLVQGLVRRAAQRAGLQNNGPHMLRHTFCSHLAMRGAPARAIQELAGHADLTTTQRYMHLTPAAIDSAIRLLEAPRLRSRGDIVETGGRSTAKSLS